jgi:hypothetical protein
MHKVAMEGPRWVRDNIRWSTYALRDKKVIVVCQTYVRGVPKVVTR